jgi:phosphoribosylamine---glycine ligase
MRILVIGSGGREHALVWKLAQSPSVTKIWCAPGNGGISGEAECLPVDVADPVALANLAEQLGADLTVIGPELPLVRGVADEFKTRGLKIFGPQKAAAQLEGSKLFAKEFMLRNSIPTAKVLQTIDSLDSATRGLSRIAFPAVLKADGLCAGKGVLVAQDRAEAEQFAERCFDNREFGDAGSRVLVEEALSGPEVSIIVVTDGALAISMAPARDYKRLLAGDRGPNTGGMGAYSVDSLLPGDLPGRIFDTIVCPTLRGLQRESIPYHGFLYFGLMLMPSGPKVLEYNCRSGDPETQALVMRMNFDLAEMLLATADNKLGDFKPVWEPAASACVVLAAETYPQKPSVGRPIAGLKANSRSGARAVFHAGTQRDGDNYYTNGGRILSVCASGKSLAESTSAIYDTLSSIKLEGAQLRNDIGSASVQIAH